MAGIPTDEKRNIEWDPVLESSSAAEGSANQRVGITVECPVLNDDFTLFFTPEEITIKQINFVLAGTTDVTVFVRFDSDRSAGGTSVINAGTVVTNTTTGQEETVFDNAVVPAGSWLWVEFTAVTDNPDEINVSLVYS